LRRLRYNLEIDEHDAEENANGPGFGGGGAMLMVGLALAAVFVVVSKYGATLETFEDTVTGCSTKFEKALSAGGFHGPSADRG